MRQINLRSRSWALAALFAACGVSGFAQNYVSGGNGTVLQTRSAGRTFRVLPGTGTNQLINGIYAFDRDTLLFVTSGLNTNGGRVFRSGDGGRTWANVGGRGVMTMNSVFMFNNGRAFAGADDFATHPISSNQSNDFGKTWSNDGLPGSTTDSKMLRGSSFAFAAGDNGFTLHRTLNNGQNWTQTYRADQLTGVVKFGDTIVSVSPRQGFRSTDNGRTWSPVAYPALGSSQTVAKIAIAPGTDTLLAVGNGGYLIRSNDGGRTWQASNSPTTSNLLFVRFKTKDTVWIGGSGQTANRQLYWSGNRGLTWNRISPDSIRNINSAFPDQMIDVIWKTPQIGYLIGNGRSNPPENQLFRTLNGGRTWDTIGVTVPNTNRGNLSLLLLGGDTVLMGGRGEFNSGDIFRSLNGGRTWTTVYNGNDEARRAFRVESDGAILSIAGNGVWRSTNRGTTWALVNNAVLNTPFFDLSGDVLVGDLGRMYQNTSNQFETVRALYPFGFPLGRVNQLGIMDSNHVFAVGNQGTILRSSNRGLTWAYVGDTTKQRNWVATHFLKSGKGWALSNEGFVFTTADTGRTWAESRITSPYNLRDIKFFNETTGIVVGDSGTVFHTTNGGTSWTRIYAGTRQNLAKVAWEDTMNRATSTPVTLSAARTLAYNNEVVAVPITVRDFNAMRRLQGTLTWDTTKLTFVGVGGFALPSFRANQFATANAQTNGFIRFDWGNALAVGESLADDDTLFTLNLRYRRAFGDSAMVSFLTFPWVAGGVDSSLFTKGVVTQLGYVVGRPNPDVVALDPLQLSYCAGATIRIPFTATPRVGNGNVFTVEISDPNGVFTGTRVPGVTVASGDTVTAVLPDTLSGAGYRVRLIANIPSDTSATNPTDITVFPLPATPLITAPNGLVLCPTDSVMLVGPAGFAQYLWSNGATNDTIYVRSAGALRLRVANSAGCISALSPAVTVTTGTAPAAQSVTATGPTTVCTGTQVTINAPNNAQFTSFLWSDGVITTTRTRQVGVSGLYRVRVRTATGLCYSPFGNGVTVTVNELPAQPTISYIPGTDSLIADITGPGWTYVWRRNGAVITGATGRKYLPTQTGTFTVTVVNANCNSPVSANFLVTGLASRLQAERIALFPNPSEGRFTLELDGLQSSNLNWTVLDMAGRSLSEGTWATESEGSIRQMLDLSSMKSGVYMLRLNDGVSSLTLRLTVQK